MIRVAVCLLIFLTTTSFKPDNVDNQSPVATSGGGLLASIGMARGHLEKESVRILEGVIGTRRVRVGKRNFKDVPVTGIVGREMALAIMDSSGEVHTVRAIKRDKEFEVLTPGFVLSMRRENGINSDISCVIPAGGKVLAVKYPVSNEGNRFGAGVPVIEAVYTPYSAEIKTEEIIKQGIDIQEGLIDRAYSRLKEANVLSRAFPGKSIIDVIPRDVLRVLLMNEHIDPGEFRSAELAKPLVERVLTIIATNREKAYMYSISKAGARGLVQMIPSTYSLISKRYPSAGLNESFVLGMADPINAIIAQVLLCDADWQTIKSRAEIPSQRIGPYLAAAYNGGVGRVLSVLAHDELDWMDKPDMSSKPTMTVSQKVPVKVRGRRGKVRTKYVLKSYTQPIFKNETSKYVSQYHWISDFFVARGVKSTN